MVVTSAWVSPRVNSAEPWARGRSPTSQVILRISVVERPPIRRPSSVIIFRMYSYFTSS